MPRVNLYESDAHRKKTEEIRADYGNMLSVADAGKLLNYSRTSTLAWLDGVPFMRTDKGGRRYFAIDVARKIERNMEG